ncbi:hypothetical protein BJ742DRAFT_813241 [Cladochytrium replicatum]|nr:hypothetical protein BJ742DRAFT_813241 [Cladochytrium replicatum]
MAISSHFNEDEKVQMMLGSGLLKDSVESKRFDVVEFLLRMYQRQIDADLLRMANTAGYNADDGGSIQRTKSQFDLPGPLGRSESGDWKGIWSGSPSCYSLPHQLGTQTLITRPHTKHTPKETERAVPAQRCGLKIPEHEDHCIVQAGEEWTVWANTSALVLGWVPGVKQ